jgi:hypothetical protein
MSDSDLSDEIQQAAAAPAKVTVDGVTIEQHDLPDMVEADKHLARRAAARSPALPIRVGRFRPSGAI